MSKQDPSALYFTESVALFSVVELTVLQTVRAERHILRSEQACHSCESDNNLEGDESKLNMDATCYV